MALSPAYIEISSWRLVAELHRRHPGRFSVIETHPGGGLYDCLSLVSGGAIIAHLNRTGSWAVMGSGNSEGHRIECADLWPTLIEEGGVLGILNQMSAQLGFAVPGSLPASSPETLVYRVIAGILAASFLDKEPLECRSGYFDSAGYPSDTDPRLEWFKQFRSAELSMQNKEPGDLLGQPRYRFWFIVRKQDGLPLLCFEKTGTVHLADGSSVRLSSKYIELKNKMSHLVGFFLTKV